MDIGGILRNMDEVLSDDTMMEYRKVVLAEIYLNYETEKDFMPQFRKNVQNHTKFLLEIPLLPKI